MIKIVDEKLPNIFKKDDFVEITLEYLSDKQIQEDFLDDNKIVFYVEIYEMMPRGFYTKYHEKNNKFKRLFLYNTRGYVVIPQLEQRELFEIGDCIKITLKKANI